MNSSHKGNYVHASIKSTLLVQLDSVAFQGKNVVGENDDFIISSLVISYQKLTGSELVGVDHCQQLQEIKPIIIQIADLTTANRYEDKTHYDTHFRFTWLYEISQDLKVDSMIKAGWRKKISDCLTSFFCDLVSRYSR